MRNTGVFTFAVPRQTYMLNVDEQIADSITLSVLPDKSFSDGTNDDFSPLDDQVL